MARHRDRRARLGSLAATRLHLGAPWRDAAEVYARHRDELLERFPPDANGTPAAFWAFDPAVPDDLRAGDDVDIDRLARRRARWLRRIHSPREGGRAGGRRPRRPPALSTDHTLKEI